MSSNTLILTYSFQNDFSLRREYVVIGENAEDYRTGKNVTDFSGNKNIQYFYDGNRVIMEADDSGSITSHNLYGTHLAGRSVQGEDYYYLYNAHGDVVMLLDAATGAIAGTYRYDAFGNVILETGTPDNSVAYAGYQYDEETGLYYLNARYYDSATARFLTEDTYRGSYRDPLSLNRYTYCHNNPVAYTDPSGHFIIGALLSGGLGALVGGGMELISQKVFQKKDKVDWKAVRYEVGIGALFGALGGVAGGVAKTAGKTVIKTTVKSVAEKAVTTGAMEDVEGFASDVGRQVIVDGKSLSEVDYRQAVKTGAISGLSGMIGYTTGELRGISKSKAKNVGSALPKSVTENVDDAVDSVDEAIVKTGSTKATGEEVSIKKKNSEIPKTSQTSSTKVTIMKQTDASTEIMEDVVTQNKYETVIKNTAEKNVSQKKYSVNNGNASQLKTPKSLLGGAVNTRVYIGVKDGKAVYVGITNDVKRRQREHASRFDYLQEITTAPLTRNQARAIEQVLIEANPHFENRIKSIDSRSNWYTDAITWGKSWLEAYNYPIRWR